MKVALASIAVSAILTGMTIQSWGADASTAPKAPRFTPLTMDQLNVYQKPLGEQIMKVSSIGLGGPYSPLLRSPVLGQRMFDLLYYLRWNSSVPLRLNEFAILIIGRQWRSQVEWFAHAPLAIKAGLPAEIVAALKAQKPHLRQDLSCLTSFLPLPTTPHRAFSTFLCASQIFYKHKEGSGSIGTLVSNFFNGASGGRGGRSASRARATVQGGSP